jgi:hypothetical protein
MATVYYKATRPNGTDFRTGTLKHEAGVIVEHPVTERFGDMGPNEPGTYLSTSVAPGEVLLGGRWPCALWRVKPVGRTVKRTDGAYPHKRGMRAYRVVEELPAHMALGPNGEAAAAVIDRAGRITGDEARALDAAWDAAWDAALDAARDAARGAARDAAWDAARDAALALLTRDLIAPDQFDALYGPWASVIGEGDR